MRCLHQQAPNSGWVSRASGSRIFVHDAEIGYGDAGSMPGGRKSIFEPLLDKNFPTADKLLQQYGTDGALEFEGLKALATN